MDAKQTYEQMGNQMMMLLGDYSGENGIDAFWRANDIIDDCMLVRSAIRGPIE